MRDRHALLTEDEELDFALRPSIRLDESHSESHLSHPHDWKTVRDEKGVPHLSYVGSTTGWYMAPPCEGSEKSVPPGEMCYVIYAPDAGRVKIGFSRDVAKRFASLQTGSPVRLELVATLPGGRSREIYLHEKFARYRTNGEWFSDEVLPELLSEEE